MNDAIKQAEAVLAYIPDTIDPWALREALSALLALAKDQEAELARLKAPLGDEWRALV